MNIATYEQVEEVLNKVTFEQQVEFIKRVVRQEQIVETYGERPWVTDGDYIKDYMAEYNDDYELVMNICSDLELNAEFHDWILDLSKTGYNVK